MASKTVWRGFSRVRRAILAGLSAGVLLGGCGEDEALAPPPQPDPAVDQAAIEAVLVANEIGGPERCAEIYTDAYLAENWNEDVTAYGGSTPLEKCEAQAPYAGVTADDVKVVVDSIDADTAVASAKVRAQFAVGFTLVRDGDSWRIDGFSD